MTNRIGTPVRRFLYRAQEAGIEVHALEIFEHDRCTLRWSAAPYRCDDRQEVYSLSKSFLSTAAGVAFGMGVLHPDDRILRFFPEYEPLCEQDARWGRMTLGHVLSMNTGHACCAMPAVAFAPDGVRAFFESPLTYEPGSFFAYNTAASFIAAEAVRRATGCTVPELLAREVFPALEIDSFTWDTCTDGRCQGGTGLHASCDDIAKLGRLYLNGGRWNGRQVIPEQWVRMAGSLHSENKGNGTPDWCAGYGYQFWMNRRGGFRGDGAFGQLCVIRPDTDCVAAVTAECGDMSRELDLLWDLLDALPGTSGPETALPELYAPKGSLDGPDWETGWLNVSGEDPEFRSIRLCVKDNMASLWLAGRDSLQKIVAVPDVWTENTLWTRRFFPTLVRQMPRRFRRPLRFAAAAWRENEALVFSCRCLNTPHAFEVTAIPDGEGIEIRLSSRYDVFDEERTFRACPAPEKQ